MQIIIERQDECRPVNSVGDRPDDRQPLVDGHDRQPRFSYPVIKFKMLVPRVESQWVLMSANVPDDLFDEDVDGNLWYGDYVADNYATRGLLLECLECSNTGYVMESCYYGKLVRALTELWD